MNNLNEIYKKRNKEMYERIRTLMKKHKLTRTELAKRINVSYNTLTTMFQRESKHPSVETLNKIAKELETTIGYITTGNNDFINYEVFLDEVKDKNKVVLYPKNDSTITYYLNDKMFNAVVTLINNLEEE